jgi:hypothetical protein
MDGLIIFIGSIGLVASIAGIVVVFKNPDVFFKKHTPAH